MPWVIPVRPQTLESKFCADGCARGQTRPVTSSVLTPSTRWPRPVSSGEFLKRSDSRRLSQRQKPFAALPIQYFDAITVTQKNKEHGVKHCDLDIQLDQRSRVIGGFSKVYRFWVEVNFFNPSVGTHHGDGLLMEIGSTASSVSYSLGMWSSWIGYNQVA